MKEKLVNSYGADAAAFYKSCGYGLHYSAMIFKGASEMAEIDNREILALLKSIDKRLEDIYYHLADIKREMPKVPYYGDLLHDIIKGIEGRL